MLARLRQLLAAILTITLAIPLNAIASDPSGMNGAVSYTYDPVGEPHAESFDAAGLSGWADELRRQRSAQHRHVRQRRQHDGRQTARATSTTSRNRLVAGGRRDQHRLRRRRQPRLEDSCKA